MTLLVGAAGCGKTVLGLPFLVEGARRCDEPGVLLTFEGSTAKVSGDVDRPFTLGQTEPSYRLVEVMADAAFTYFRAVALDYDGTLADGVIAPDTKAALAETRTRGLQAGHAQQEAGRRSSAGRTRVEIDTVDVAVAAASAQVRRCSPCWLAQTASSRSRNTRIRTSWS